MVQRLRRLDGDHPRLRSFGRGVTRGLAHIARIYTGADMPGMLEAGETAAQNALDEDAGRAIRNALLDVNRDDAVMIREILGVNRMRSSGVSVGSGEDTPEGFNAETSEKERKENLRAAEAAGADSSFEVPREVRREEPSLTQLRPPPMAGFGANRPETELGPEVEKLMDDVFQKVKAELRQGFEESRRLRPENRPEGPDDRARGRELLHYFYRMLELHPEAEEILQLSEGSDSSGRGAEEGPKKWTQRSAKVFMMQAVLRAMSAMDQEEQRHFMESNRVEKVLKDALTLVIDQCKARSGDVHTGYLLHAVTCEAGAGPILEEGLAVTFARACRPLGRQEEGQEERQEEEEPEADPDRRSEMEKAYLRAKEPSFRYDSAYRKFREILARRSDEARAWPVLDEEDARVVEQTPEAGPAPEAAPMPVDEGPAEGETAPPAPDLE